MDTYHIWCPTFCETSDDAAPVEALDAEDAVLQWAEDVDDYCDLAVTEASPVDVCCVLGDCRGDVVWFTVSAEATIDYHALRLAKEL